MYLVTWINTASEWNSNSILTDRSSNSQLVELVEENSQVVEVVEENSQLVELVEENSQLAELVKYFKNVFKKIWSN